MSRRLTALACPAAAATALVAVAAAVSNSGSPRFLPAPPTCSAGVNREQGQTPFAHSGSPPWTIHIPTPGLPGGHPLYLRFCGPAQAVIRLHAKVVRITDGGHCVRAAGYGGVAVGLVENAPAPAGQALTISIHSTRQAGTFKTGETPGRLVVAAVQLPGARQVLGAGLTGTITIAESLRAGTFALRLRDMTPVTGSWTCG